MSRFASTEASNSLRGPRGLGAGPYRHGANRTGYTHEGQLLGSSIGPGSTLAWVGFRHQSARGELHVELERSGWNRDAMRLRRFGDGVAEEDREVRFLTGGTQLLDWLPGGARGSVKTGAGVRWNRSLVTALSEDFLTRETNLVLQVSASWDPELILRIRPRSR